MHKKKNNKIKETDVSETLPDVIVIYPVARAFVSDISLSSIAYAYYNMYI